MTLDGRVRGLETLETPRFSGARVRNSAPINLPTATDVDLTFDSEDYDTDDYHNLLVNPDRLTVPISGWYRVMGCVAFSANSSGFRQVSVRVNGGSAIVVARIGPYASAETIIPFSTEYELAAGDYVTVRVYQNSGSTLTAAVFNATPALVISLIGEAFS